MEGGRALKRTVRIEPGDPAVCLAVKSSEDAPDQNSSVRLQANAGDAGTGKIGEACARPGIEAGRALESAVSIESGNPSARFAVNSGEVAPNHNLPVRLQR